MIFFNNELDTSVNLFQYRWASGYVRKRQNLAGLAPLKAEQWPIQLFILRAEHNRVSSFEGGAMAYSVEGEAGHQVCFASKGTLVPPGG